MNQEKEEINHELYLGFRAEAHGTALKDLLLLISNTIPSLDNDIINIISTWTETLDKIDKHFNKK